VVQLLFDVLRQIFGEGFSQWVVAGERPRPLPRRLRQRDRRADDLVLEDQVFRPELREPRVLDERFVGRAERADDDVDLPAEAEARGRCFLVGGSQ
jgi:hypothetical protein